MSLLIFDHLFVDLLQNCFLAVDLLLLHSYLRFEPFNIGVNVGNVLPFKVFDAAETFVECFSLNIG
jgi:hypothetical protein